MLRIFPFTPRVRAVPKFPSLATFQAFCSRLKNVVNNVKSKYFRQSHRIMDSDNESCHSESEFYYPDEDFGQFRAFHSDPIDKNKHVICRHRSVRVGKNWVLGLEYGARSSLLPPFVLIRTSRVTTTYNTYVSTQGGLSPWFTSMRHFHGIRSLIFKIIRNCNYMSLLQSVKQHAKIFRFFTLRALEQP